MISNVGQIPLHGIRLLGQSRKSETKIGRFGTGLKEAIALALRKGYTMSIWSGLDKIEFSIQEIDGQREVCFRIILGTVSDSKYAGGLKSGTFVPNMWHGMGFSPELGRLDWTDDWQIFREIICNAIDEGDWSWSDHPEPGRTLVVLEGEYSGDIFKDIGNRILPLRKNYDPTTCIMNENSGRVYHKGVFIKTLESIGGAFGFSYNLPELKITESRTCSETDALNQMSGAWSNCKSAYLWTMLFSDLKLKEWSEFNKWMASSKNQVCVDTFYAHFGPMAVPIPKDAADINNRLIRKGFHPIVLPDEGVGFLVELGVTDWKHKLSFDEQAGIDSDLEVSMETVNLFNEVWKRLNAARLTRGKQKPALKLFSQVGSEESGLKLGMYRNGTVYVAERVIGSREERITILEEFAHHITGAGDLSNDVQNWLLDAVDIFMN